VVGIGRSAKNSYSKGTTMKKSSQIQSVDASTSAVPERVSVAMAEIAENMGERHQPVVHNDQVSAA